MTSKAQKSAQPRKRHERKLRYQHVYDMIEAMIREQGLQPGDKLPSTAELAEMAKVSVISVRRALDELAHQQKITRHQGVGTFVAPHRITSELTRSGSLLQMMRGPAGEVELHTDLVSVLVGLAGDQHAIALGVQSGSPVWEVTRVRRVGATPKVLERAVLPLAVVPSLDQEHLAAGGSLYDFLRDQYGLSDDLVEQAMEVVEPSAWEREHLNLTGRDDVVRIRGTSIRADGVVFDSFQQTYLAHDFVFYVSASSRSRLIEPRDDKFWAVQPLGPTARSVN
ncbi:GntR family transcriptional regulator [Mycolicibacterium helvum]|uniref:GntR family transcriptional regulator n=3 Tax=Mycolicibacterium helvum TaxID=1534349 RepID=A0A7I7TDP8_9MYCO|nr:GntR family transcriptional regulator [Mycolicibacterium helvum]